MFQGTGSALEQDRNTACLFLGVQLGQNSEEHPKLDLLPNQQNKFLLTFEPNNHMLRAVSIMDEFKMVYKLTFGTKPFPDNRLLPRGKQK